MSPNAALAGAVLGRLAGIGVRDFVLCAGARNLPLLATLLARAEENDCRTWRHFDERTAAFFALGLAKRERGGPAPVAVVTTSGTAAAQLLPAAVEAHYSGIPLVLITADRPASHRGSGAPQAIEQVDLFGPYADSIDLSEPGGLDALSGWRGRSPLHLNVSFAEPAADDVHPHWAPQGPPPEGPPLALAGETSEGKTADAAARLREFLAERDGLLVLIGELPEAWRAPVESWVASLGCPLWAEATSGLRESALLRPRMRRGEPERPRKVLRLGGVPSLRLWRDLEDDGTLPLLSISPRPFSGLARASDLVVTASFPGLGGGIEPGQVEDPTRSDAESWRAFPRSEPALVAALSREIPSDALVFLGNSLPIREWNLAAAIDPPHPRCFASRGANGIDGQIATYLGLSEGEAESWGIFGDLTALCDLNAPALLAQLAPGKRRIVVINNGGGRIFSRLPAMSGLSAAERQIAENRHDLGFGPWAAMWGLDHRLWRAGEPPPRDLGGAVLIEAVPDEAETEAYWASRG